MQRRRSPHRPFVVTIAAAVTSVACGGSTAGNATGTKPDSGVTPTDAGGDATADADATLDAADATTDADAASPCPPAPPDFYGAGWETCTLTAGVSCHYDIACQSGAVSLGFACDNGTWHVAQQQACAQPYDSCPGTSLRCVPGADWTFEVNYNYNPPGPCPPSAPSAGGSCQPGGFGGDPDACGYPCDGVDAASGWTVLRCDFSDAGSSTSAWTSDNACNADP
jgi:hypothetical protein